MKQIGIAKKHCITKKEKTNNLLPHTGVKNDNKKKKEKIPMQISMKKTYLAKIIKSASQKTKQVIVTTHQKAGTKNLTQLRAESLA